MPNDQYYLPNHGGGLVWAAQVAQCTPQEILDFSASINPLGLPSSVLATIQSPELLDQICRYPDPNYTQLKQAIALHHHISPDWILPGNGSAELLTWACRDLARLKSVAVVVPAFGDYLRGLQSYNAQVETIDVGLTRNLQTQDLAESESKVVSAQDPTLKPVFGGSWGQLPEDSLIQLQQAERSQGLLLNNPHNPTGSLYQRSQLLGLLDRYELVVIDEAFMDFLPPAQSQSLIDVVEDYDNLVILRSLTKFYALAGLRIGYAITHPDRLSRWQTWRDPWSVNCLAEQAAIASLRDLEFQQKTWEWLPEARSHLYNGLQKIKGLEPLMGAANFLLVKSARSVIELRNCLLQQHRILIRDCHSFQELGDRYFRVCVKTPPDHEKLFAALHDIT